MLLQLIWKDPLFNYDTICEKTCSQLTYSGYKSNCALKFLFIYKGCNLALVLIQCLKLPLEVQFWTQSFEKPGDSVKPNADIGIQVLRSVGNDLQLF
jgi:hypothetical protein